MVYSHRRNDENSREVYEGARIRARIGTHWDTTRVVDAGKLKAVDGSIGDFQEIASVRQAD